MKGMEKESNKESVWVKWHFSKIAEHSFVFRR